MLWKKSLLRKDEKEGQEGESEKVIDERESANVVSVHPRKSTTLKCLSVVL